jgi:hypothetical protein
MDEEELRSLTELLLDEPSALTGFRTLRRKHFYGSHPRGLQTAKRRRSRPLTGRGEWRASCCLPTERARPLAHDSSRAVAGVRVTNQPWVPTHHAFGAAEGQWFESSQTACNQAASERLLPLTAASLPNDYPATQKHQPTAHQKRPANAGLLESG